MTACARRHSLCVTLWPVAPTLMSVKRITSKYKFHTCVYFT